MVVECTSCQSKFRMDPTKIGPKGARVRCPKCKTVFPVFAPSSEPAVEEVVPPQMEEEPPAKPVAPLETPSTTAAPAPAEASPPSDETPSPAPIEASAAAEDPWASVGDDPFASASSPPSGNQALGRIALQKSNPEASISSEEPKEAAPPPPPRAKQVARPLESLPSPRKYRIAYGVLLLALTFGGLTVGLTAMGVRPTPHELNLLFKYGKRNLPPGIHILTYQASFSRLEPGMQLLHVAGKLYNSTLQALPSPQLRLEVFTPEGEYKAREIAACCQEAEIAANSTVPFSMTMQISDQPIGSYKVSLEK